jgi:hypothetical protein
LGLHDYSLIKLLSAQLVSLAGLISKIDTMYYFLLGSIVKKEIGVYPQLSYPIYEGRDRNTYAIFEDEQSGVIRYDAPIAGLKLHAKAKLTDYIENSPLLVSERFFAKLLTLNIQPFRARRMLVQQQDKVYDYLMFSTIGQDLKSFLQFIDFEQSNIWFFRKNELLGKVNIKTMEDYIGLKNRLDAETYDAYHRTRKFDDLGALVFVDLSLLTNSPDLLETYRLGFGLPIVNERFRSFVLENGFTGMQFQPITEHNKVLKQKYTSVPEYMHPA